MTLNKLTAFIIGNLLFCSFPSITVADNNSLADDKSINSIQNSAALSGREILDEISKRHDQPYEFEIQDMILMDKSANKEQREMHRYKRDIDDNESRYVSVFLAPSGIKGVSLLTWQHKNNPDDQWIYLPAYGKKLKRIAKGGRRNYFMGTDYTFEDLASETRDNFDYQRLPDERLNNIPYFVIKAAATEPQLKKETGYAFRKLWISQTHFLVTRVDFFDKRERLIKRQLSFDPVHIKAQVWRHTRTEMEHFKNQHKTITTVRSRSFESSAVPERNFRERAITNGLLTR